MPPGDPPIRVALDAHVVGRRKTGNETYVLALGAGLAARSDVDVTAWVDASTRWPVDTGPQPRLRRLAARTPQLRIPFELPLRAARDRADLLHVQYVAPPVTWTRVVTVVHDVSFEDVPDAFPARTRWRLRSLVRLAVRRSAVVVTPSAFSRERLLHHYALDPDRVIVTPLGLPERLRVASRDDARVIPDLPRSYVLSVGGLHPRKNVPRLVAAVAAARAAGADLGLVLAGGRAWRAREVDAAISAHDAGSWTRSIGHVDDESLAAVYAGARVVAYPSLYEGFGLPVLEAMAAGIPVVASATTAIPEVAGTAAILVDPTSVDELADAIVRAACDEETRRGLIEAGCIRAAGFTTARLAEATVAAYRIALDR